MQAQRSTQTHRGVSERGHGFEVCGIQVEGQSESECVLVVRSGVIHGEAMEN